MIKQYDFLFKYVIIGNSSVGKSSLLKRFADDNFQQSYLPTIGVDFRFNSFTYNNNLVKLQIWDTAGQQRFRTITSAYYKGANVIIIVYDKTNKKSFQDIQKYWLNQVKQYAQQNVELVIVQNKSDLIYSKNDIEKQQISKLLQQKNIPFYRVSAKTGQEVQNAFKQVAYKLIEKYPNSKGSQFQSSVLQKIRKKRQQIKLKTGVQIKQISNNKCCK